LPPSTPHIILAGGGRLLTRVTRFTSAYRTHALGKAKTVNYSGNHKKSLNLSVTASLKKLQTEYIDLLYLHWWVSRQSLASELHFSPRRCPF
jgi:aryl-alcohol dehydrogenase-like predicted oxidoreductase